MVARAERIASGGQQQTPLRISLTDYTLVRAFMLLNSSDVPRAERISPDMSGLAKFSSVRHPVRLV